MLFACHSLINLPLPLNASRRLCVPQRTVTHRGAAFPLGVTLKKIPLGWSGLFAIVSDKDFKMVSQYSWRPLKVKDRIYARTGESSSIGMHQLILPHAKMVDHRDRNGLNNTRRNLRACNQSQNNGNCRKQFGCSSRFKGVCWHKGIKKWTAAIMKDGKRMALGAFTSEVDAAKAYNRASKKLFGRFARINAL